MRRLAARFLVPGEGNGELRVLSLPLSLWGGYDIEAGVIIDATQPQRGLKLAGRVLAMREARGSSSSSSALVESVRCGTAPAAIILGQIDPILIMGSLVAADLYAVQIPIVLVAPEDWPALLDGARVHASPSQSLLMVRQ